MRHHSPLSEFRISGIGPSIHPPWRSKRIARFKLRCRCLMPSSQDRQEECPGSVCPTSWRSGCRDRSSGCVVTGESPRPGCGRGDDRVSEQCRGSGQASVMTRSRNDGEPLIDRVLVAVVEPNPRRFGKRTAFEHTQAEPGEIVTYHHRFHAGTSGVGGVCGERLIHRPGAPNHLVRERYTCHERRERVRPLLQVLPRLADQRTMPRPEGGASCTSACPG